MEKERNFVKYVHDLQPDSFSCLRKSILIHDFRFKKCGMEGFATPSREVIIMRMAIGRWWVSELNIQDTSPKLLDQTGYEVILQMQNIFRIFIQDCEDFFIALQIIR